MALHVNIKRNYILIFTINKKLYKLTKNRNKNNFINYITFFTLITLFHFIINISK
jgi:hypothetical protein